MIIHNVIQVTDLGKIFIRNVCMGYDYYLRQKDDNKDSQEQSDVLLAFQGKNKKVPVWFMRQAGRYLPQYQALKANRPLSQLFRDPEVAGAITLQPLEILGVDAAILFADILTMPSGMGFKIEFINGKGQ